MARKQFVSSKKNAPSRAVSSKEAALHGRVGDVDNGDEDGEEVDVDDDDENDDDSSGSDTPGSPASSNGSSSLFTSDEQDEAIGNGAGDVDTPSQSSEAPVAVEVMPSSVGRGKQLRFPTVISRGKESRVFTQDGSQDEDGDSDSDDSLLSIASDEEEEDDKSIDGAIATQQNYQPEQQQQQDEDTTMLDESETTKQQDEIDSPSVAAGYPIKGFRARKRHRPDSGYYKQMSTYVRDCLLSVRDGAEAADVLTEESHDEFRRKLSAGTVERVAWKESSPPVEEPVTVPAVTAATKSVSSAVVSEKKKEEPPADQVKKEKHKKEHRTKEKRSESSSGSKSSSSSSSRKREEALASFSSSSSRKREEAASVSSSISSSRAKETPESAKSVLEVKKEEVKKEVKREERSVLSSSVKAEQLTESTRRIKTESSSTSLSSGKTSSSSNGASSSSAAEEKGRSTSGSKQQTPALCSSCKKKLSDDKELEKPPPAPKKTVTIAPEAKPELLATFIIPTATGKDVTKLRAEATKLNDEARALKHEGNRKGAAEPGSAGQIAQGKFYLRSSAKFFQHALKLADIKAAYKEMGDERHARQYGDYSVTTLSQTSSLIESTIRTFQSAGSARMVALGYKLASIVHLTIYRMQHLKLFSLYSDLFTPGRSPDTRQNGTPTPPIGGTNPDSKEAAVRTHLLKEMEHTLRGFEMWRRYESCKVVVLPRITNPAIADLSVLFEDLHSELGNA